MLDMKTIFITLVIGHMLTVFLIIAYWRYHKGDSTLNIFFIAKCVQAAAWLLFALRGIVSDLVTILFANTFLFLGTSLETVAFLKLINAFQEKIRKIYLFLTAVNIACFFLIAVFYNEENLRIAVASFGIVTLIILPVDRMIRGKSSALLKFMGYLYLLVIFSLLGRGVAALSFHFSIGLFTAGVIQTYSFLAIYLVMVLGNTGFILLLKESEDHELVRLAESDDLTDTLNRRTFIARTKRYLKVNAKKKMPVSFLLFDVDNFKKINDKYGHDVGDRVLQDLTERINQLKGPVDLFSRFGGDEFTMLMPGMDEEQSAALADQIRLAIEGAVIQGIPLNYTLSIGLLTIVPDENTQIENLYISCDKALYGAKRNGKNGAFRGQYQTNEETVEV